MAGTMILLIEEQGRLPSCFPVGCGKLEDEIHHYSKKFFRAGAVGMLENDNFRG
jgi:hypothetical protein